MRTPEQQREEARQRVAATIVRTVPGVTTPLALELMAQAKVRHIALHAMDRHLSEHPDALLTGDPDSPLGVQRLAEELHAAGFTTVRLVGCSRCGRTGIKLAWLGPGGRICGRCARQTATRQPCARCGRVALLEGRRAEGRVCGTCVAADPNTFTECGGCGRRARPYRRLADGTALCQRCIPRQRQICSVCGRSAPVAAHTPTGPVCPSCYRAHAQPHRECSRCGRQRPVKIRATAEHGDLCDACVPDLVNSCITCGRERPGRAGDNGFACNTCRSRARPARRCALCGQHRLINADWPIGPVCAHCYQQTLRSPAICVHCGRMRILIGRATTRAGVAAELCGPCVGGPDYACVTCDTPGPAYAKGECARCVLAARLRSAFADTDRGLHHQYATLVTVLANTAQPESLLANWLKPTHPAVQLVTSLARDRTPLTHALLDALPQTQQLLHLRRLLVFAAVLPPRPDEYLHRLGPWLRDELDGRPAHHVRLVHPYAEWDVLHRARRRTCRRGRFSYGAAIYARARITAALDLLGWLDQQHTTLDRLTQDRLDLWLDDPANRYKPIRDFLHWATKTRHARELTVPPRRGGQHRPVLEEQQRWQQLRRCLDDDTLPLAVRVVGALTLLFGLTTSRILDLTVHDIAVAGDDVRLTIGSSPIDLPPRVADLVRRQYEHATSIDLNAPELPRWLLPGHLGTLPINPAHMSNQLAAAGVTARDGRHAALVDLAAALPPPVLASLLGVHVNTAIAWSHRAQQDWSAYLAARHREQRGSTP